MRAGIQGEKSCLPTLTVGKLLQALKCDFKLEGVRESRGVVQDLHVVDVDERHSTSLASRTRYK